VKHPKGTDSGEKVHADTRQKKQCNMMRGHENAAADDVRHHMSATRQRGFHSFVRCDEQSGHRRN